MELSLPVKLENFVNAQVRAGKYVDSQEVVRDALRRMQETEAPDANLVREAINLSAQAQRDVLGLLQRADTESDLLHQVLGAATSAVDASLDVARKIPVARDVEKVVRGSLGQVTNAAERGEHEAASTSPRPRGDVAGARCARNCVGEGGRERECHQPCRSSLTMRAALLEKSAAPLVLVDDVDVAELRPDEVRVRVSHCGVCHSDLSIANGTYPVPGPMVLGHEAAGVVEGVGVGVSSLVPGDKVVLTPIATCDECYWCLRGEYGCCVNSLAVTTGTAVDGHTPLSRGGAPVMRGLGVGAFAELVVTPASGAVKVADDTPLDVACVIGCAVQTGVGAVLNTARVEPGATVLVIGAGGVGIAIVQGARVAGATRDHRLRPGTPTAGRRRCDSVRPT